MAVGSPPLPQCRSDLVIRNTGEGEFVVKLPASGKYFQIGEVEQFLLAHLNGETSSRTICKNFEQRFGDPLTRDDLDEFIDTVKPLGLFAKSDASADGPEADESSTAEPNQGEDFETGPRGTGNLLFYRRTLFNPDALLNRLEPWLRFLWMPPFVIGAAAAMFFAMMIVWDNSSDLATAFPMSMRWESMALFWVTMITVTLIHEMAHGLTCKHYGGEVKEIGVLLVFFTPCFFCNVTDAWLIPKKSHRLWVTLAGSFSDLCLWALAVFVWRLTIQDSMVNYLAWIVMSTCGGRILFNFNPLLRLDGYYLLSDWLEVPNLRTRATDYWMANVRWLLWGADRPPPQHRGGTLLVYGGLIWLFALFFLDFVVLGLLKFLGGRMGLPGLIFTLILLSISSKRVFRGFFSSELANMISLRPKRTAAWICGAAGALFLSFVVPVRNVANGDFEVRPGNMAEIHAPVSGFVRVMHCGEGDLVRENTLIAELEVPDLDSQILRKQAETDELQATLKSLRIGPRQEEVAEQIARIERAEAWRNLARQDLEQAKSAFQQEVIRLDHHIAQTETELKYTINSTNRAEKLYRVGALAGEQYRAEYKKYELAASQLAEGKATRLSKQAEGTRLAESELAKREKEILDARSALSLMQAGGRTEDIEAMTAKKTRVLEELSFLKDQKSKLKIKSTAEGTISTPRMNDRVGQLAELGALICTIEDVSTLNVEISVSEEDVAGIHPDQTIVLKARSLPFETFEAKVDRVAPRATLLPDKRQTQNSVKVYCHFVNHGGKLRSGMTGVARINRGYRSLGLNMINQALRYFRTEFWW